MKRLFILLPMLSCMPLLAMMDDFNDVESTGEIKKHILRMVQKCSDKCSFAQDVMSACTRSCMEEESKRAEYYLIRKYTASCHGLPSEPPFNFEPTLEQQCDELRRTFEAYDLLNSCAKAKLTEHNRRAQLLLKMAQKELTASRAELPSVVVGAIDLESKIRRRN